MQRIYAFVAEHRTDFIYSLHAADDQPLQVQFGGDTQIHVHVQRVVVRDKRPRVCPAIERLHHRRADFLEAARIEAVAYRPDGPGACHENLSHFRVDDQIQISATVAQLDILQAMELLRQRAEGFRQ